MSNTPGGKKESPLTALKINSDLFPQPAAPAGTMNDQHDEAEVPSTEEKQEPAKDIDKPEKKERPKSTAKRATKPAERNTELQEPRGKRESVLTYFSAENYKRFDDLGDEIRKAIQQSIGKRLKSTNIAEYSIMIGLNLFEKDPETFLREVEKLALKN
jgi:hypothetical protein